VRLKESIRLLPVLTSAAVLVGSCGSSGGSCPDGQIFQGSLYDSGSCFTPNPCRSWTIFIAPGWPSAGEPHLVPDRSLSPARADLRIGSRMNAGVDFVAHDPPGCSYGVLESRETWRTTDPAVLRVEATAGYTARFLAVAPGTARVLADGLNQPGGRTGSVELSICADPATNEKACARTPLVIRVVP